MQMKQSIQQQPISTAEPETKLVLVLLLLPPSASSDKQFSARERREKLGRGGGKPNSKPPDMNDPYGIDIAECLRKSNRPRWGTQTFKIIQTKYGHYSCVISGLKVYS